MTGLRVVFMGTPDFSVPALNALIEAGHEIVRVYSQPPRPAGRGQRERPSPVHAFALSRGLAVATPKSLKGEAAAAEMAELKADVAVVVAYGLILPKSILDLPRLGSVNIHASLLPRWRGAAPIQRAIEAGDPETGVTIMRMDEGLDTGPMLLSDRLPIDRDTTAADLHDALAEMGARLIVDALDGLASDRLLARPQPEAGVTYARKLEKDEGRLDWSLPAVALDRKVRAFTPWPGAYFEHDKTRIKVSAAEVVDGTGPAGTVLDERLTVACGQGALRLSEVQRPGKGPLAATDFLRGYPIKAGTVLS